jgi:two-component system OmpR family sensor kinase
VVSTPEPAPVEGVPDELHRLALNLMENALAHTPPGTRVEASVRRENGAVVLEVADNGPGIPEAMRDRVFDRFVRSAGDAAAGGGSGSGLGLSIVRAVAESHGGSVELAATDVGARFVVRLPEATAVAAMPPPVPAAG